MLQMLCFTKKGFYVVHINIHYLYPKLDEIQLMLSNNQTIDCVCVCETYLDSTFVIVKYLLMTILH